MIAALLRLCLSSAPPTEAPPPPPKPAAVKKRTEIFLRWAIVLLALTAVAPASAQSEAADAVETEEDAGIARPYLRLGWRVMGLADHVSHGPDFTAGVLLWDHLLIGVGGFARPGPINPKTFDVDVVGEYQGRDRVDLRGDGALIGLTVGARFDLSNAIALQVPVTLGFGAFGYYLHNEDRNTPDGRRVSEWENELLDGRDASGGMAIDAGLQISIRLPVDWLRLSAGVHYAQVIGYDAFVRDDYRGFSGSIGLEMSNFR
ncbi:MAG: hypothetical protein AAF938_29505 [Myxococcota bacterium]